MFFDFSIEGKIQIYGERRVEFLNGLVSNDVHLVSKKEGIYAAFLDRFGRIISDCHIYDFADSLLVILPVTQKPKILEKLCKDAALMSIKVEDVSRKYALFCLVGETLKPSKIPVTLLPRKRAAISVDLLFPGEKFREMKDFLQSQGNQQGTFQEYEVLRLEAGIPLFGIDFDEKTVLPEIGEEAISYTKGCYVGQEVIVKIKDRGKGAVRKKLVKLIVDSKEPIASGTKMFNNQEECGWITSSAWSSRLEKVVALGYVLKGFDGPYQVNGQSASHLPLKN